MRSLKAERMRVHIRDIWESPELHILVTKEDDVFVARCLDFTVSSHGSSIKNAVNSLAEAIKEYVLTAIEADAIHTIFDPMHSKYWRMFNELETKRMEEHLKRSLKRSSELGSCGKMEQASVEITYA